MVIFVRTKKNFTSNSGATYGIRTTAPEEIELGLGIGVGRSFPPGQLFWNPSNMVWNVCDLLSAEVFGRPFSRDRSFVKSTWRIFIVGDSWTKNKT